MEHSAKSERALRSEVPVAIIENVAVWCEVYLVSCPLLSVFVGLKVFLFLSLSLTSLYIPSLPFSAIFSQRIVAANRSSISVCCLNFVSLSVPFRISLCLALSYSESHTHTKTHFLTSTLKYLGLYLSLADKLFCYSEYINLHHEWPWRMTLEAIYIKRYFDRKVCLTIHLYSCEACMPYTDTTYTSVW